MDSKPIVVGGTVPFEEEGRYHSFTYERNEAEIENPAREERRTFNETDNDSFKLSTTVECDYERTDHQLQCNTTSADELAKTEGNTAVCQLSDSNSDKENNDTKEVQRSVVYISNNRISSELKKSFQNDPRVVLIERNRQPDITQVG
ncbi:Hypothetical predicted protein [Mytilus galloprovincialis]|uniref:Uncharacterized protein n=1 Tax=Mytilus galloprovincialis TaxID=29158 RepID=A0A8B6BLY1_MYTGA|nr:Hypothetical predicted protein [Mytilus galloprovincialis]